MLSQVVRILLDINTNWTKWSYTISKKMLKTLGIADESLGLVSITDNNERKK
jgi:hypothetical protein